MMGSFSSCLARVVPSPIEADENMGAINNQPFFRIRELLTGHPRRALHMHSQKGKKLQHDTCLPK